MKAHSISFAFLLLCFFLTGSFVTGNAQTVTNTVTQNGFTIKKQVSNSSVPSGVVFTYTIFYTIPAGASNVVITDQISPVLVIDNVIPGAGCGTPVVNINTTTNVVTYTIASVSSGCSGTFQINVHFPAGTTCPGAIARNRVCLRATEQQEICTDFINTTATAANPFGVSKGVMGLSWNPSASNCQFVMPAGDTVMYNLLVYKISPYQGNTIGQINLNNAVVTDVLPPGAQLISSNCGASQLGNTVTWNVGNLNAASPWVFQSCQIKVFYPAGTFPVGTQIPNTATLSGANVCNQPFSTNSNTTCIQVVQPIDTATLSKSVYLPNKMPGCQGIYYVQVCNNGTGALNYSVVDNLPAGITVNSVSFFASAPVTATATLTPSGTTTFASGATGSVNWTVPAGNTLTSLQVSQTGLTPGSCLTIQLFFTINSTVSGNTTITNCATLTSPSLTTQQKCVTFVTSTPAPKICVYKDICNPITGYQPGSTVRYRLRLQNIGSLQASGFSISDVLDPNLTFAGNVTAYFGNAFNTPCGGTGATPWPISSPVVNTTTNTVTWSGLNIAAECQNFYYPNCGAYGTQGVTFYFIEFDVTIKADAASGIVPNQFTATGGNLIGTETSNTVYIVINVTHGTALTKELSTDNSSWANTATVIPGGPLFFRLNLTNTGSGPIYDVRKVDLLAFNNTSGSPNDVRIMNRSAARGSLFEVNNPTGFGYTFTSTPAGAGAAATMPGSNLSLQNALNVNIGATPDAWPYPGGGKNVGIGFGAAYALASAGTIGSSFQTTVSGSAQAGQRICNDFAAGGSGKYIINGAITYTTLTPASSDTVCAIATRPPLNCCENLKLEAVQGKCCIRLATDCAVKEILVTVSGGTIANANWNCTAPLGAYQGQSTYSFVPLSCAPTMDICFNALTGNLTGSILVNLVISFDNGEKCERSIKLDGCRPPIPSDCCGDWELTFKNSFLKKTGIFEYTNPSTQTICSVTITAAPGLTAGNYTYDGGPLQPMTSTSVINFVPPAQNTIKFWLTGSFLYNSNIILTVNYCDGTFCQDTLRWKGGFKPVDIGVLGPKIPAKLWAAQFEADRNSRFYGEVAAIAVSIDKFDPNSERGPFIFAASAGRVEGETLRPEQAPVANTWMGAYFAYATMLGVSDYPDRFIAEKRLAVVIGDNSGLETPPPLVVTFFDREGDVLASSRIENYTSGDVITSVEEVTRQSEFSQAALYPNPAGDQSLLTYAISRSRNVRIDLLDAQGRWLETLEQGSMPAGFSQVRINTQALPAGIYFVRLQSEQAVKTLRLSVVR